MRELRLYSRAFNRDEKIHYLFDTDARYLSEIASYLLFTIPFNDYRLNNGKIIIGPKFVNVAGVETEVTLSDLAEACYVADVEYDANSNITRAVYYFVRRCYDQSGNMILDVERDLWASSLLKATFGAFHVARANRATANYVLPDLDATYDYLPPQELGGKIDKADACVLFVMSVGLTGGLFTQEVSKNLVLAVKLSHIYNVIHSNYPEFDSKSLVEKAIDLVSGIHEISWANSAFNTKAAVTQAWIIPNEALPATAYQLTDVTSIKTRGQLTKGYVLNLTEAYIVPPHVFYKNIDVETAYEAQSGEELELGFYLEIGTANNSMPLRRGEDFAYATYKFVIDTNGLSVMVEQGVKNKDITEAFALSLNLNGTGETSLQATARTLAKMTSSVVSIGANALIGNIGGVAASIVGTGASLLSDTSGQNVNRASSAGDGGVTFDYSSDKINCPYVVRAWYRSTDYLGMLEHSGAPCDLFTNYAGIKAIETSNYFDTAISPKPTAFLICDYVEVDGLNGEEEKYLKDEFARGIKFKYLTT